MPPPELPADAPVPDVLKPHVVCPGKTLWQYPDATVCHSLHMSRILNLLSLQYNFRGLVQECELLGTSLLLQMQIRKTRLFGRKPHIISSH